MAEKNPISAYKVSEQKTAVPGESSHSPVVILVSNFTLLQNKMPSEMTLDLTWIRKLFQGMEKVCESSLN